MSKTQPVALDARSPRGILVAAASGALTNTPSSVLPLLAVAPYVTSDLCSALSYELPGTLGKGVRQGCIVSPCLFNFYAEYIMRNAGLEETCRETFQ